MKKAQRREKCLLIKFEIGKDREYLYNKGKSFNKPNADKMSNK